jgi:hemolysin III
MPEAVAGAPERARPRLRGVFHQYAFVVSVLAGVPLIVTAPTRSARFASAAFAVSVAAMFGVSALYHRVTWRPRPRAWVARADHATIYVLIAGTYTPYALLALSGGWRRGVLAVIWTGAIAAIALKFAWGNAPKALAAALAVALGWAGVAALPQLTDELGAGATLLLVLGGVLYTAGAAVYALRRPDPVPAVFGYHELFHVLVVAGVACHYASVAFFVVPAA